MKSIYRKLGTVLFRILLPIMRPVLSRTKRVYVAIVYGGKVLLVKNWLARDTWRLPGGGIGKNETPIAAAIREVWEELGVVLKESELIELPGGTMQTDRLGYSYVNYVCVLKTMPHILPDAKEIVACEMFNKTPDGTQAEVQEVLGQIRRQKLL